MTRSDYCPPDVVREHVLADLDVIDAAQERIRTASTELVGQAFRLEMAERLEQQCRVNRGLSCRVFGELEDPVDGEPGLRVRDALRNRLRITSAEVKRRMKLAARLRPRRQLTGPPRPAELPVLGDAFDRGDLSEAHVEEVRKALDHLPARVAAEDKELAEKILVDNAREHDPRFVTELGRGIADTLNPDGLFDERDRQIRRGLSIGAQGPDGMSRISGFLTPEVRSYLEAIGAAVRPGHHVPGAEQTVVDAASDPRTKSQRMHDALGWGLQTALASGNLGEHRGLPVTVIATTTVAYLEQAAQALADPNVPMPPPARTGGGSSLPMRDLIRMAAAGSTHYLAIFENHSARPLYLGRTRRFASADQRIICFARDHGCTHCDAPGYECEVHHAPVDWNAGGPSDANRLFFACGPSNQAASHGGYTTELTDDGRLAWSDGTGPPKVNRLHHPEELLEEARRKAQECAEDQDGDPETQRVDDEDDP